jgi:hypothetical protein
MGIDAIPKNEYCMSKNWDKMDTKTEFHEYQASLISVWRKKVVRLTPHSVGYNQSFPTEGAGKALHRCRSKVPPARTNTRGKS